MLLGENMRIDIRFAGISLNWTEPFVLSYAKKLKEMDYAVRVMKDGESNLIAYSHKSFSQAEAEACLKDLKKGEGPQPKATE
jgi:hypothetical protein